MSKTKLKNAPLKEVIFELHWACGEISGIQTDTGFELAQGRFAERLKHKYPLHRSLLPPGSPIKIFGAPLHQYWRGEFEWPVIQHGQGMIAVNEIENGYEWKTRFKPLVIDTINDIIDSYEEKLIFDKIKLQYIDAWDLNEMNPIDFMTCNLQTEIKAKYTLPGELKNFNVQQIVELKDGSTMNLNISSGTNNQNQKKSIVWSTTVEKRKFMGREDAFGWIEMAHDYTSNFFKQMLNPEFYASLDR